MPQTPKLYTLTVFLVDGPLTEKFLEKNRIVSRTIQIRGSQTFGQLHRTIFKAFNREEEHLYEFQVGGKGPQDPEARRYVSSLEDDLTAAGLAEDTRIDAVGLSLEQPFGYWFDYGDDWWHQINVEEISDEIPAGRRYPKVTERVGDSPPQYPDMEE